MLSHGDDPRRAVYLTDFGLSRPYRRLNPESSKKEHVPDTQAPLIRGAIEFASLNNHLLHSTHI